MKVTVIGSNVCCDTLLALTRLAEKKADVDFKNISGTIADLKTYLNLRDTHEVYADVRAGGGIGIPCFILEDGTVTRDMDAVLN